jgi:endo-1,4-beta-xylanase
MSMPPDRLREARRPRASGAELTIPPLTRRSFLGGAGALAASAAAGPALAAPGGGVVPFGAAIQNEFFDEPGYRQLFLDHCDVVLPMNELKFGQLRPERDAFRFGPADRLVDFARSNGRTSRGHTFCWWNDLPPWLEAVRDAREAERTLRAHIETVAGRYAGRLESWDVVNEVIAFDPAAEGRALRDYYWHQVLGPRHIPIAFEAAAAADPGARLVINDYDLEFVGTRYDLRREIALSMVRQLKDAGLPVHAVGIQAHLYAELRIDVEALGRFGEALKAMDCGLLVTELDVIDWKVEGGAAEQDAAAGRIVSDLLDGVMAAGPPEAFITWGLTDRHSWIGDVMPRTDGNERPLPFDAQNRPKPWYETMRRRLAAGR